MLALTAFFYVTVMKKIIVLWVFMLVTLTSYSQNSLIGGKWWGILDISGRKLTIGFDIHTDENPLLIGVKGKTLDALQVLVRNLLQTYSKELVVVNVDVGSYRENRKHQLEVLATKIAKEVAKTKVPVKLKPMSGYERRIIHNKLSEWRDVFTESEGEGSDRCLVIKPKRK